MLKFYLLMAIASVTVLTAGGTYLASNNHAQMPTQILSDRPNTTVLASVWDRETESYSGNVNMTVYRSPSCGCCGGWIEHAKKHGFQITDIKTENIDDIKREHNIPENLASCHTTIIDGYVMEGHIPADEIKRFLKQKPKFAGLSVPGMPLGTPGMESGNRKQPFDVLALSENGQTEVFKTYENY
ncbi:DUF411 domain-containing protein [Spirulina sp. 06S082]|uniref:DUF411 domain-containing protein n=1 Tax=Spirulina sp. 06S082 TaxID=3110248 RepID=UPI002B1F2C2F|nr:DUF411 domain-containing protein [Spirulina sp. 06S082]MEA5472115.1 DUF411 domain-containing protein [Spirulina sp. 06S082]